MRITASDRFSVVDGILGDHGWLIGTHAEGGVWGFGCEDSHECFLVRGQEGDGSRCSLCATFNDDVFGNVMNLIALSKRSRGYVIKEEKIRVLNGGPDVRFVNALDQLNRYTETGM